MNRIWVGTIIAMLMLVTLAGVANAEPKHEDLEREEFLDVDEGSSDFDTVAGNVSYVTKTGRFGDVLTWMIVEDDDTTSTTDPARVVSNNTTRFNTTLTSYMIHAQIDRQPANNSTAVDWIGMTFGESATEYYLARFNTQNFSLVQVDKTTGNATTLQAPRDFGDVPSWRSDVDDKHRYSLLVDGTTLSVQIDGWHLGNVSLPTIPNGDFGIAAADGTSAWVEQIVFGPLDIEAPHVEIYAPFEGTYYLGQTPVPAGLGERRAATGTILIGADIQDEVLGAKNAWLSVDGLTAVGSVREDPGIATEWTYDTSQLTDGLHRFTVWAQDYDNNRGSHTIFVFTVNGNVAPSTASDAATWAVSDLPLPAP